MKKRSDGYYATTKIIDGRRHYFYGKTKNEALRKASEYIANLTRQRSLFGPLADAWWEHYQSAVAFNSLRSVRPAYKRAVQEFGDCYIEDVTPPMIAAFIHQFAAGGRAAKTVRTQLMVINLIFKYAINYMGINISNPARDVSVPRGLPKTRRLVPSSEDIKRVKENAGAPFGLFALMALYTGMRKGELLALEWSDVDLKSRRINISKSIYHENNRPRLKTPKTEKGIRSVPILSALLPYLKKKRGLIFTVDGGPMSETQFQKAWAEYAAASGVACTAHQLRHCFSTMLFENDISPKDAQYLLGHAQLSTTMDVYTEIREARVRALGSKIYEIDIN